jgi:hypothetical protein
MNETLIFVINLIVSAIVAVLSVAFLIGKYKEKVDNLEKEKDKNGTKVDDLRSETDKLLEFKVNAQKFMDSKIYQSGSPLKLTDFGQKLVEESGFVTIFGEVRDDLVMKLEEKKPLTQYDVQEIARALMDELTKYSAFQPLKTYAFKNGKDYQQILRAGAILLRDYYLEKHPKINE